MPRKLLDVQLLARIAIASLILGHTADPLDERQKLPDVLCALYVFVTRLFHAEQDTAMESWCLGFVASLIGGMTYVAASSVRAIQLSNDSDPGICPGHGAGMQTTCRTLLRPVPEPEPGPMRDVRSHP